MRAGAAAEVRFQRRAYLNHIGGTGESGSQPKTHLVLAGSLVVVDIALALIAADIPHADVGIFVRGRVFGGGIGAFQLHECGITLHVLTQPLVDVIDLAGGNLDDIGRTHIGVDLEANGIHVAPTNVADVLELIADFG